MNRREVRRYAVFLILTAICVHLISCTQNNQTFNSQRGGDVKNLVMWKFKSNKEDYMIYNWVEQWNEENPDIQVKLELIPYNDYLTTKLPTAFATNSAPDIYMISAGGFLRYAGNGCMLPLDEYIESSVKDDFYELSLKAATYQGKLMGIPIEREPLALFYNKKAFRDKNLLPPSDWEGLEKAVEILNTNEMDGIYLPVLPNDYQNFIFYSLLMQLCDGVVDEDTRKSQFGTYGIEPLNLWRNLSKYNYNLETSIQSPSDINPLASGKAATQVCGYWAVKTLEKYYPDFEYGVTAVPHPNGGRSISVYGGWYQAVNPGTKYPEEAAKFTMWMWGQDSSRLVQWCTEASTKFPARKSIIENNSEIFSSEESKVFKEYILPNALPEPRYPVEVSNAVSKAIQDAMFTDKEIEEILKEADSEINNYLQNLH